MSDVQPLPERARLFHVGIPKSGTTSLQMAASSGREDLRRHGVLYPGNRMNQRDAVLGFMERRWGWTADGIPPRSAWDDLMREIEADTERRVFFGHEFAAEADAQTAERFVEAIGERCHVVITLRSIGAILPSAWQQYVKAGVPVRFDDWLTAVLSDPPDLSITKNFHDRNDQAGVVRRWSDAVGADRVTVVVLDKKRPELLFSTFEQLLALPPGTLADQELGGFASNRGLTVPESELFLALNEIIRPHEVHWKDFQHLIRRGAVRRILETRAVDEEKPQLPAWAAKRAAELGNGYAESIAAIGANVVGDLQQLGEEVAARQREDDPAPTHIPLDLAAEALAGTLSAATARGAFFGDRDQTADREIAMRKAAVKRRARQLTVKDVVWFVGGFVGERLRRLTRLARRK